MDFKAQNMKFSKQFVLFRILLQLSDILRREGGKLERSNTGYWVFSHGLARVRVGGPMQATFSNGKISLLS